MKAKAIALDSQFSTSNIFRLGWKISVLNNNLEKSHMFLPLQHMMAYHAQNPQHDHSLLLCLGRHRVPLEQLGCGLLEEKATKHSPLLVLSPVHKQNSFSSS